MDLRVSSTSRRVGKTVCRHPGLRSVRAWPGREQRGRANTEKTQQRKCPALSLNEPLCLPLTHQDSSARPSQPDDGRQVATDETRKLALQGSGFLLGSSDLELGFEGEDFYIDIEVLEAF